MSFVTLRPYQEQAKETILQRYAAGQTACLAELATGLGKTILAASIIAERGGRALFLAHRDELIDQAVETLSLIIDQDRIGRVKAQWNETHKPIIVASIQTLSQPRRLQQLIDESYRGPLLTVVCDEAHHSVSPSWRRVLDALGISKPASTTLFLGITATPERLDGRGLEHYWGKQPVFRMGILDGITSTPPYLCDLRLKQVPAFSLRNVTQTAGDYSDRSLSTALLDQHGPETIVQASLQHAPERRKLVFLPTIDFAEIVTWEYQANGVEAALVTEKTPAEKRRELTKAFKRGEISALCNVGIFTEGFDAPIADCAVIGRPTKSKSLFTQQIGRITRLYPGKRDGLILDLVGNSDHHRIVGLDDLTGLDINDEESIGERLQRRRDGGSAEPVLTTGSAATAGEPSLFSILPWKPLPDGSFGLMLPRFNAIYLVPTTDGNDDHCTVWRLWRNNVHEGADPPKEPLFDGRSLRIDYAQGMVEDVARREGWFKTTKIAAPWRKRPVNGSTRSQLRQRLINRWDDPDLTQGEAQDLLDEAQLAATVSAPGRRTRPW